MKIHLLIILPILFSISSCGMFSSGESTSYIKSNQYLNSLELNMPSSWEKIKSEGSDFAIRNKKNNSIFLVNSACRKYEGSSLNSLTSSILSGIDDLNIISRNNIVLYERDAQEIRVNGKVDGVKTFFNIITTQKNYCIYDYVLISNSLKKLENDYEDFNNFVRRIRPE